MAQLETSLGWVMHHLTLDTMAQTKREMAIYEQAFLLCAEMLDTETPLEARQTMASLCAKDLGCDRVVLVRQDVFGLKIEAISGESRFDRKSRINDLTRQAAHEAQLRRAPVRWNRGDLDKTSIIGRLAEMHGDAVAMAVPLTNSKGEIDEVVVLHWASADGFGSDCVVRPLDSVSSNRQAKRFSGAWILARSYHSAKMWLKRLFGPRAFQLKLIVSTLITLFVIIFVVDNTLRADVVIDDPDLRVMSAPMDNFIEDVFVIPGDVVAVGQPLLRLADDEIKLRIAELDAQIARHGTRGGRCKS